MCLSAKERDGGSGGMATHLRVHESAADGRTGIGRTGTPVLALRELGGSTTRQQLDVVAAQIAEELSADTQEATGSVANPGRQGRILDIRVEDLGSVIIFAHIEQPLGPENRLCEQACMALHALEDSPVEATPADKRNHLLRILAVSPKPFEGGQ